MRFRDEVIGCTLLLVATLICVFCFGGCTRTTSANSFFDPQRSTLKTAWAGVKAAAAVTSVANADITPAPVPPVPNPTPEPGTECDRCNGTGRKKPDGRIEIDCPDCGGDGKLSYGEMLSVVERAQSASNTVPEIGPLATRNGSIQTTARFDPELTTVARKQVARSPKQTYPLQWFTSLEAARDQSKRSAKPAMVYWYGNNCAPCRAFERDVLGDANVRETLGLRFVCVRINAEALNQSPAGKTRLRAWNITSIPQVFVVPPDWRTSKSLKRTNDPQDFVQQLNESRDWNARQVRSDLTTRPSGRVRVRVAKLETAIDDIYGAEGDPVSVPLDISQRTWESPQMFIRQVQYGSSLGYGSNGGSGAYRVVVMNGSGYGSTAGSYQGAHGYGGGRIQYMQRPVYAARPTYYYGYPSYGFVSNSYGAGRTIVCGPWGCVLR
jgi:hypothetical protein